MRRLIAMIALTGALAACGGGDDDNGATPTQGSGATATPTSPAAATTPAGAATQQPTASPTSSTPPGSYTVVSGDTLWDIAERFGTTIAAIVELNGLEDADAIEIGQVLKLPGAGSATPAATATP